MPGKLQTWILCRVSTDIQKNKGEDIPVQKHSCCMYAKEKGWEVNHVFTETLSGYYTAIEDRLALQRIRKGALNKEFDILLVYHSDRLGRQIEYSAFISMLYKLGIQVWSTKEGELGGEEISKKVSLSIKYWQSKGESKKISFRIKDAMKHLNEKGAYLGGTIPYGYELIDTGLKGNKNKIKAKKILQINPVEAEIVKQIFDMAIFKNYGSSKIAKELNRKGIDKRGSLWRHNTIVRMLRNPVYIGYKQYGVKYFKREEWKLQPYNSKLQIINEKLFKQVQNLLDQRCNFPAKISDFPSSRSKTLLGGMAICGYCGRNLKSDFSNKRNKRKDGSFQEYRTYRYRCHFATNGSIMHPKRQYGSVGIDRRVEEVVLKIIHTISKDTLTSNSEIEYMSVLKEKTGLLKHLEEDFYKINNALERLDKLFDDVMIGKSSISIECVTQKLEVYGTKKLDLLNSIEMLKNDIQTLDCNTLDLNKWLDSYEHEKSIVERTKLLARIIDHIIIRKESLTINFTDMFKRAYVDHLDFAHVEDYDRKNIIIVRENQASYQCK